MLSRLCVLSFVAALAGLAACSTGADKAAADEGATTGQDLHVLDIPVLGTITPNQPKLGVPYTPPTRDAFAFNASQGAVIVLGVSSHVGDAVAYLTDAHGVVLAANDDADANTHNSRIVFPAPASATYYVVFEDYNHLAATFDVSLSLDAANSSCTYGHSTYADGDTFSASDGCNTCSCTDGGVSCTSNVCACTGNDPGLTYYGNPDQCKVIHYNCPPGQVRFSNDCGCGCEILTTTHRPRSSQ